MLWFKINVVLSNLYIYIYIYIYKTETSETSTIFHVSTIFKYNIKTNLKKRKEKKNIKTEDGKPLRSNI